MGPVSSKQHGPIRVRTAAYPYSEYRVGKVRVAIARNLFPVVAFNPLLTAVQSKRPANRRKGVISLKAVLRTRAAVK